MSRLITGLIALAALSAAPYGLAKPPDLPEPLLITVQPIQNQPVEFQTPLAECQLPTCRSVLDNLRRLVEAGEQLELARKQAVAGHLPEARERAAHVRKLVPGSTLDDDAIEFVQALEGGEACCPCFDTFVKSVRCYLSQAEHWAHQVQKARDGKTVMVDGLLKAAHLAACEGRMDKAAELVRQAHAVAPERVESDPLVYKMHLLEHRPVRGGEEAAEPTPELPVHPKQGRKASNTLSMSVDVKMPVKWVTDHLAAAQFRLESPPKDANGMLMIGLNAVCRPTVTVHTRCPASGVTWHVCFGGALPVVWPTQE